MKFIVLILLLASTLELSAVGLTGIVLDENHETLPYATVRVKHKRTAVLSDSLGIFTFPESAVNKQDTLTISYVGYTIRAFPLAGLDINDTITVEMNPGKTSLPEFAVTSNKRLKRHIKGKRHSSGILKTYIDRQSIGDCVGYEFHAKKGKKLIVDKVGMMFCDGDSMATHIKFRINIYDMSKVHRDPTRNFVNVLNKPIYFDFILTNTDERKIEYTLPDPIVLPEDAMVELEVVDIIEGNKLWYKSNVLGKRTWTRVLEDNFWIKDPFAMPFFVECLEADKK